MSDIRYKDQSNHPAGLQIQLFSRTYVFPWSQFLYAEGDSGEIRMAFSTHDVTITGVRLDMLLAGITVQKLSNLKEPLRAESMMSNSGLNITNIVVKKVD
jgi:hypothetical protein